MPSSNPSYYTHPPPPSTSSFGPTPVEVESLRTEKDKFQRLFESKSKQCSELLVKMNELKGQVRRVGMDVELREPSVRPHPLTAE